MLDGAGTARLNAAGARLFLNRRRSRGRVCDLLRQATALSLLLLLPLLVVVKPGAADAGAPADIEELYQRSWATSWPNTEIISRLNAGMS